MHPGIHDGRRTARINYIYTHYQHLPDTLYVDASPYPNRSTYAVATVDSQKRSVATASTRASTQTEAEEIAIALSLTFTRRDNVTVITDAQEACQHLQKGLLPRSALRIIEHSTNLPKKCHIFWTPGNCGVAGNEAAHDAARKLVHRTIASDPPPTTLDAHPLLTYNGILPHYKLSRRTFSPPHCL